MATHFPNHNDLKPAKPRRFTPGFDDQPSIKVWFLRSWLDIGTQLFCVASAYLIYIFAEPLLPHYLPLFLGFENTPWGIKYGQPFRPEYINTIVSAVLSFVVPFLVIGGVGLWKVRSFWDTDAAIMGLGYALSTGTLFQAFIKWVIGGLRPHFLSVCKSPIPPHYPGKGATGI